MASVDHHPAATSEPAHRPVRVIVIFLVVVVVAVFITIRLLNADSIFSARVDPSTNNAYVDGDSTSVAAHITGYVTRLAVGDNQTVKAGDIIASIEADTYQADRDQAASSLAAARAALASITAQEEALRAEIAQSEAAEEAARADRGRSTPELARQRALIGTDAYLGRALDLAEADQKRVEAAALGAKAAVEVRRRQLAVLSAQRLQALATVDARQADLDLAQITLGWTSITAPIDGTLGTRRVRVGDLVRPGTEFVSMTPLDTVWVTANFNERQMPGIRIGQKARLRVDTFPDATIDGHVIGISPLTGDADAAIPADNTTGNFTKVPQRIPVRIAIDWRDSRLRGLLRPGMSVLATVLTRVAP